MKNSELYHLAQIAVVQSTSIAPENKIKIVKLLLENESLEQFREKTVKEKVDATL